MNTGHCSRSWEITPEYYTVLKFQIKPTEIEANSNSSFLNQIVKITVGMFRYFVILGICAGFGKCNIASTIIFVIK